MPRFAIFASLGALLLLSPMSTHVMAQAPLGPGGPAISDYFAAPGLYGTSYGYASYGVPRTHSSFSAKPWSPYYATVPSFGFATGPFGVGLWRPNGPSAAGDVAGVPTSAHSYRTFPVVSGTGLTADQIAPPPPIGVYAPTLGPDLGISGW